MKRGLEYNRRSVRWERNAILFCLVLIFVGGAVLPQRPLSAAIPPAALSRGGMKLKFKNSPMDLVLQDYSEKTGRTLLQAPNLPKANITLEGQTDLTLDEYLLAIDTVLAMNNITLLRVGDKFLKVVPIGSARQEEMGIRSEETAPKDAAALVSQMIQLQYITINEAKQAIDALKHPYAQVHLFERINSILLTDTAANVNRIMEIIKYIDQPAEAKEEPNIIEIHYASAADIKRKLEEVIAEAQKDAEKTAVPKAKTSGAPGVERASTIPGVMRAAPSRVTPAAPAPAPSVDELIEQAERGILIGKVKIIADERTNILIIITRRENMGFFEKIIKVLDVMTAPDVMVKVIRLEYADAETLAASLNSLIGGKPAAAEKAKEGGKPVTKEEEGKSAALNDYVQQLQREVAATKEGKSKVGELSAANIKILADKRTNSLLIMATKADLAALQDMVKDMDIMLSQVLIEVVIFRITLASENDRGIDWVQRALISYQNGADGSKTPVVSWAGAFGGGNDRPNMKDPLTLTTVNSLSSVGNNLTYFFSFYGANLDTIIKLVANNTKGRIMASPQILTLDNKPATLSITSQRYFFQGQKYVSAANGSGTYVPDVALKELGTKLTCTPHINEKKYVVMEIVQTFQRPGATQTIADPVSGTTQWPTIDSSEFTASVAVRSGETIVLGGMIDTDKEATESKVPLLGDIPLVGNLFKYKTDADNRNETVVFITPHVLNSPAEVEKETARIRKSLGDGGGMWPKGWSDSKMADSFAKTKYWKEKHYVAVAGKSAGTVESAGKQTEVASPAKNVSGGKTAPAALSATNTSTKEAVPVAASAEATKDDGLQDLDPDLKRFIERQEKRWSKALKEVDESIDKENRGKTQ